jgi:hypothetical protein
VKLQPQVEPSLAIESIEQSTIKSAASVPPRASPFFKESSQTSAQTDLMFAYFDFIEAESLSHIEPNDFKFLEHKGCFHLPARPILDDFVRQYFLHVHPVLPVLDERVFWELYFPSGRRQALRKIPLFVFRAMLFASCSVSLARISNANLMLIIFPVCSMRQNIQFAY